MPIVPVGGSQALASRNSRHCATRAAAAAAAAAATGQQQQQQQPASNSWQNGSSQRAGPMFGWFRRSMPTVGNGVDPARPAGARFRAHLSILTDLAQDRKKICLDGKFRFLGGVAASKHAKPLSYETLWGGWGLRDASSIPTRLGRRGRNGCHENLRDHFTCLLVGPVPCLCAWHRCDGDNGTRGTDGLLFKCATRAADNPSCAPRTVGPIVLFFSAKRCP